jgi:biopolymer transport protein TolQ
LLAGSILGLLGPYQRRRWGKLISIIPLAQSRIWDLVTQSTAFGAVVLSILAIMSIVSWAIMVSRWRHYRKVRRANARFLRIFRDRSRISAVYSDLVALSDSPLAAIFEAGAREYEDLRNLRMTAGMRRAAELAEDEVEIILLAMERAQGEAHTQLSETTTFLATTANTAPFLGLLGTIWGVMEAFMDIGLTGSASLAVVAPGIAEALIATIVGLAAAIPAVVGFNYAGAQLRRFDTVMAGFITEFLSALRKETIRAETATAADVSKPL